MDLRPDATAGRLPTILKVLFVGYWICHFLLTPLGLEPRTLDVIHGVGFVALGLVFACTALDVAAFVLLTRNPRRAAVLAILGMVLLLPAVILDQAGQFASVPAPARITAVEYAAAGAQIAIAATAWQLRRTLATKTTGQGL